MHPFSDACNSACNCTTPVKTEHSPYLALNDQFRILLVSRKDRAFEHQTIIRSEILTRLTRETEKERRRQKERKKERRNPTQQGENGAVNAFSDLYTSYLRITLSSNSNGGFPTPDKSNFPR